jgi:hypothetical protein
MKRESVHTNKQGALMKKYILFITLFTLQAVAKESVQEINDSGMIQVQGGLRCIREAGNPDTYTQYKSYYQTNLQVGGAVGKAMELTHTSAYQPGCEIEKLDQIAQDSLTHFGFKNVQFKLTKNLEASFINGFNKCVARYNETLKIKFATGVELISEEGELRSMNDCTTTNK